MTQPKLYRLLERLDGRELSWFDKFLASPYFNSNDWPRRLWACLRPAHPQYDALSREEVFEQLCPGEPFDGKFLNDRYSELSRLAEAFFFQQEFRREEALQRRARRYAYRSRGLYGLFAGESRRQADLLLSEPYRSPANLAEAMEVFDGHYFHSEFKSHSDEGDSLHRAIEQLDQHFVLLKLKYATDQLARQQTLRAPLDGRLLDAVLVEAAKLEKDHPAIGIYRRLTLLFREGCSDEGFRDAMGQFYRLSDVLPREEQSFILAKFVALAFQAFNQGRQHYLDTLFELFRYGDEHRLFVFYGVISDATFLNACTIASHAGHFEWAQRFIRNNQAFLPAAAIPDAPALGQAILLFAREDYAGAYHCLNAVYKRQSAYKLRVRPLYVRCLLGMHLEEPRYDEPLRSTLDAFGQYIRRHKTMAPRRKKEYLNFAKAVRKIALLRSQNWRSARARAAAVEWLGRLEPLILGGWLRKQLEREGQ
ncbi:MAG: hypothetical protein J5I94_07960 [Phaeodactylibacter sp.]|nr:hypothetical protein [Phaeodactylibacter sp.]